MLPFALRPHSVAAALDSVNAEISRTAAATAREGDATLDRAASALGSATRIFVLGAGRSGLALQMTAMRLMHLGLTVHVVGDATTPAIRADDLLLVASGSGTTSTILRAAEKAAHIGADVIVLTTDEASPLARLATEAIIIPAAKKLERDSEASIQYAGGLFEQLVVLTGDALFHALWTASGRTADDLWPSHSNLE